MTQSSLSQRPVGGIGAKGSTGVAADAGHGHPLGIRGASIASATTLRLGNDASSFHVTGTSTIYAISNRGLPQGGDVIFLTFDSVLTLVHDATNLILLGGESRTTVGGDTAIFVSEGPGRWREIAQGFAARDSPTVVLEATAFELARLRQSLVISGIIEDLSIDDVKDDYTTMVVELARIRQGLVAAAIIEDLSIDDVAEDFVL